MVSSVASRKSVLIGLWLSLPLGVVCGIAAPRQSETPQQTQEATPTPKEKQKSDRRLLKELDSPYRKWLEEDVVYIITGDERKAFLQLSTNEERESFIENFWQRRSSNPESADNEFKEEGGGETSTYPFEIWNYRYLEGIGQEVNLEFVDTTMTGEYHLTTDPCEKDALAKVPNAGLTMSESLGQSSKADRFTNTDGTTCGAALAGRPASWNEFDRIAQYAKIGAPPPLKFKDLEPLVTS